MFSFTQRILVFAFLLVCFGFVVHAVFAANTSGYAWGENVGWINFNPSEGGVTVTDTRLSGYAWGENVGWINFSPDGAGVSNDGTGYLAGYAWGENVGWINFSDVIIDSNGNFSGYAWGENVGWVNMNGAQTAWAGTVPSLPEPEPESVDTSSIPEGGLIRAIGDIDVYIVKYMGAKKFKRLILSPHVFESYGHLQWQDVKDVNQSLVDAFTTSDMVRATVAGDPRVYRLFPDGDTGTKRWVTTAEAFNRLGYDWDTIYTINEADRDAYSEGATIE